MIAGAQLHRIVLTGDKTQTGGWGGVVLATVAKISPELSEQKVWKWGGTAAGAEGGAREAPQVPKGSRASEGYHAGTVPELSRDGQ